MVFEKGLSFYPRVGSLVDVPTCEKIGIYRGGNTAKMRESAHGRVYPSWVQLSYIRLEKNIVTTFPNRNKLIETLLY